MVVDVAEEQQCGPGVTALLAGDAARVSLRGEAVCGGQGGPGLALWSDVNVSNWGWR